MSPAMRFCLAGTTALASAGLSVLPVKADGQMDQIAKENAELKTRLDALEAIAKKEGILPSGYKAPNMVTGMSDISLSGFVQASYFFNLRNPSDRKSDGYLFNTSHNSFSINKVKVTLASKPVETDKWSAGFRTSLIFGEDAPVLNSGGAGISSLNDLREAYVELNVPVGTGLNIKAGELISLLNWESGDGGAANPNFSQGNQWWFTGNGPSAGIQASYNFTDKVGLTMRVDNGLFQGPIDNNDGKAFSASLALKPIKDLWVNLIGWYSHESLGAPAAPVHVWGGSAIGGYQVTAQLGTGFELDYFKLDGKNGAGDADLYSAGAWIWYDFTPKVGVALRADYIASPDGPLGPAVRPGAGIGLAGDTSGDLSSLTLTLNWKPAANIKIQPEVRYDHTGRNSGLDGHRERFTVGAGATYSF